MTNFPFAARSLRSQVSSAAFSTLSRIYRAQRRGAPAPLSLRSALHPAAHEASSPCSAWFLPQALTLSGPRYLLPLLLRKKRGNGSPHSLSKRSDIWTFSWPKQRFSRPSKALPWRAIPHGDPVDFICSDGVNPPGIEVLAPPKRSVTSPATEQTPPAFWRVLVRK